MSDVSEHDGGARARLKTVEWQLRAARRALADFEKDAHDLRHALGVARHHILEPSEKSRNDALTVMDCAERASLALASRGAAAPKTAPAEATP